MNFFVCERALRRCRPAAPRAPRPTAAVGEDIGTSCCIVSDVMRRSVRMNPLWRTF